MDRFKLKMRDLGLICAMKKFPHTLKEMVLCIYLTEFVREFLCKLERKSSYFSYIILSVNKYE